MATVPELPLGQMVFFCLAKAGELVFVLFFWFGRQGKGSMPMKDTRQGGIYTIYIYIYINC